MQGTGEQGKGGQELTNRISYQTATTQDQNGYYFVGPSLGISAPWGPTLIEYLALLPLTKYMATLWFLRIGCVCSACVIYSLVYV